MVTVPDYKIRTIQDLIDISNETGSGFFATRGRVASAGRTLVTTNEDGTRGMIVVSEKIATNSKTRKYIAFRYEVKIDNDGEEPPWVLFARLTSYGSDFNSRGEAAAYIRQIAKISKIANEP